MKDVTEAGQVRRARAGARMALAAMVLVTTWSLLSWTARASRSPEAHDVHTAPQPGAAHEAAAHQADGDEPPPINWVDFGRETPPYIAMVINFGILVAGYYLLGRKPIAAALQNRRESIAKEIEDAARIKHEAEARAKTYLAKLDKLSDEMQNAREALIRSGEAERDRIVLEAEAKAERMRKDAQFMVEQELKQVRLDLWHEAVEAAVGAAEDLLKKTLTQGDQERLAEDYLTSLTPAKSGPGAPGRATEPPAPSAQGLS